MDLGGHWNEYSPIQAGSDNSIPFRQMCLFPLYDVNKANKNMLKFQWTKEKIKIKKSKLVIKKWPSVIRSKGSY